MPKRPTLYRLEVIPLTPLFSRKDPRFSYAAKETVSFGSLVAIPFGAREITGVVVATTTLPGPMPAWMKYVGPTLLPGFLTEKQFALAVEMSRELYTPLGIVLRHFFPVTKLPRARKEVPEKPSPKALSPLTTPPKLQSALQKVLASTTPLYRAAASETLLQEEVLTLVSLAQREKRQILVLVPEILSSELWHKKLTDSFPEETIALLTSHRTPKEAYEIGERIRTGAASIILGTRQALFAPFQNLSGVIMLDPESTLSYDQWEMAPRYHGASVATELARLHTATFVRLTVAPGLSYFLEEGKASHGKKITPKQSALAGTPFAFSSKESLFLVDLRKNFKKRSAQEMLSPELVSALGHALREKEHVLILVRQRGLSRVSLCDKCQTVLRCPNCANALSEATSGVYRCLSCHYKSSLFPACAACGHMHFKSFGAGTGAVARALETRFPDASISLIDRDRATSKKDVTNLVSALLAPGAKIIVSTYETARSLPLPGLSLIAMIEPDAGLFFPDYQADERLGIEIRRFGAKLTKRGRLIVQTFQPEQAQWSLWPWEKPSVTATRLLETRETLRYPPYYDFLVIDCPATKKETSREVALKLHQEIAALIAKEKDPTVSVETPFVPFSKRHTDYRILLRLPTGSPLPHTLDILLQAKSHEIRITLNPPSLHT